MAYPGSVVWFGVRTIETGSAANAIVEDDTAPINGTLQYTCCVFCTIQDMEAPYVTTSSFAESYDNDPHDDRRSVITVLLHAIALYNLRLRFGLSRLVASVQLHLHGRFLAKMQSHMELEARWSSSSRTVVKWARLHSTNTDKLN